MCIFIYLPQTDVSVYHLLLGHQISKSVSSSQLYAQMYFASFFLFSLTWMLLAKFIKAKALGLAGKAFYLYRNLFPVVKCD